MLVYAMWTLVSRIMGRTQTEGDCEQGAEEDLDPQWKK